MGKERKSYGWISAHLRAKGSLSSTTQNWSAVLPEWWRAEIRFTEGREKGFDFFMSLSWGEGRFSKNDVH